MFAAALGLLLLPSPTPADNTVDFVNPQNVSQTRNSLFPGTCVLLEISASETDESRFLFVGGLRITFQFEADNTGSNTTATVDAFACNSPDGNRDGTLDTNACGALNFVDTDGDGINDSNELNNIADGHRGTLQSLHVAGWLYFEPTANPPVGDEAEVMVCAEQLS